MLLVHPEATDGWRLQRSTSAALVDLAEGEANDLLESWRNDQERAVLSTYHSETRDHPFLDMSAGVEAMAADADIMTAYLEADEYPSVVLDVEHDAKRGVLLPRATDINIDEIRHHELGQLAAVVGGVFGAVKHQQHYYDPTTEYHQPELLRKAVPSGGSRHPTEAFLHVREHAVVPPGFYYFHPLRSELQYLGEAPPNSSVLALSDHGSSSPRIDVDVHFASFVPRAMFRYRDPRSFRALLVDIGHADALIGAFAAFVNWNYVSRSAVDLDYGAEIPWITRRNESGPMLPLLRIGALRQW